MDSRPRDRPADWHPSRISLVIPARNEEQHIRACIESVVHALGSDWELEIIVVDDGSTDRTRDVAAAADARVIPSDESCTIGELRNKGVREARGDVLLFLDADVTVGSGWGGRFSEIAEDLDPARGLVTGNVCRVPDRPTWIERVWFSERRYERPTHLGTGHLIVAAETFRRLDGFDPRLETGEDFDFCQRAIRAGGSIRLDSRLDAVHHGFPKTPWQFLRREIWHGTGDAHSFEAWRSSKVALGATAFVGLHLVGLVGILLQMWSVVFASLVGLAGLLALATHRKFGAPRWLLWSQVLPVFYLYFLGRSIALLRGLARWVGGPAREEPASPGG